MSCFAWYKCLFSVFGNDSVPDVLEKDVTTRVMSCYRTAFPQIDLLNVSSSPTVS